MKLRLSALLLVLCTAFPGLARVLSYAPYTSNAGFSAFHERTARHFLVLESPRDRGLWGQVPDRTLVLHDTQGGEPRVLMPPGTPTVWAAAMYESRASVGVPPVILAVVSIYGGTQTLVSSDGGTSWREVTALSNRDLDYASSPIDLGGPWVQGLNPAIRIGNDTWPFIVQSWTGGVFAVSATGEVKLVAGPHNTVHGQNAAGSKLLIAEPTSSNFVLKIVDVERGTAVYLNGFALAGSPQYHEGWISAGDAVYIVSDLAQGRFLHRWHDGQSTLIAGSRDATPPPIEPLPERDPMDFIAVPTHDFDGAWMVQRGAGKPTTLLRYTPASGLETLWTDPSGPEVEALIAGPSGQSVLIQTHRHRMVAEDVPFTTPAVAVWKLGEPMPREYHELYVNEEQDKGFIHANPDTMREGSTFVFNSGLGELPDDIHAPIEEWGVVLQASLRQHLILPGVARLQGGFGSEWRTDVTMYNPLDAEQSVDVQYVPMYQAASSPRTVTVTLKAHEVRFVSDALQALFLLENGGGSLHFRPASGISVVGRTYSRSGNGTYGFGMTAIDALNAAGPRLPMTFAGAFPGEHFRTNVLLTDTSDRGAAAALSAFGASGSIGMSGSVITAEAGGTSQVNGIKGSLNILQRDAGGLMIRTTRGTAIATVVAIDNRTNDPTWFPPDLTATRMRTIPVIGHLAGANGSQFRSDLYLFNPSHRPQTVVLEGRKWDSLDRLTRQFTLRPGEARVIVDALHSLWNEEGVARLRYRSIDDGEAVRVTSRTYTIDETGATYGSLIPPLDNFQIASSGDALEIIGATAGPGFRTNVGLVELSDPKPAAAPTTVRIRIVDQDHHELDSFTVTLQRAGGVQINDIFASRGIIRPAAALIVVEVLGEGFVGAYATLTDNLTNDTTYLGAQLAANPN